MNICIFCSANNNIDAVYFEKTRELGEWAAKNGHSIVFGGCSMGLMQCVAEAAYKAGGTTIGMVPTLVEQGGRVSECLTETYHCHNLSDRKDLMARHSDVFVALPGGIGTLDEIFSIAASATIGYHKKKVVLYNINGFWTSLIALLDDLQARGLMRAPWKEYIMVADSLDEIEQLLMVDC